MEIVKLTNEHSDAVKCLFMKKHFMGVDPLRNRFLDEDADFMKLAYDGFCDTYLSGLNNYTAYGSIDNGLVTAMISFYESVDTPDWYGTHIRSIDKTVVPVVLDKVIEHNEEHGRLKFFSLFNNKYNRAFRKFAFSDYNNERYASIDEFIVPAKTKCIYSLPWSILFNRTLLPIDSVVRCSYLKKEYRLELPKGGNI